MISLRDLEQQALARLPKVYSDYFQGGAGEELTVNRNGQAFDDLQFLPRVLRGDFTSSLATNLLGSKLALPVLAAPTAFHKLAHAEGEVATARAIAQRNSLMIVSMAATTSVSEIAQAARQVNPDVGLWMQIYIQPDRDFTISRLRKAEDAGCRGIVVTVDSPVFGTRERDLRNGFNDLPAGLSCANMVDDQGHTRNIEFDSALTWEAIDWLQDHTHLPIILKGILHPADIQLAIEHHVQAVMVSNHGGRQLDGTPATIRLLPQLVAAAEGRIPLIVDGGIRSGCDVLKALALGATAVAIGRPIIWGLAVNGEAGVCDLLSCLEAQLLSAIKLCGCRTLADINPSLLTTLGRVLE